MGSKGWGPVMKEEGSGPGGQRAVVFEVPEWPRPTCESRGKHGVISSVCGMQATAVWEAQARARGLTRTWGPL